MILSELINTLCNPKIYPHPVEVITTIETHISVVFLTGEFAYKLKKPVNFGFLDFSQLTQRATFCHLEIKLNRRYAPELYLGVIPLYLDAHKKLSFIQATPDDKPVEFLVKMQQFEPNNVLGRYLKTEVLSEQQSSQLAFQIANFHIKATSVSPELTHGQPDAILKPMLDNFTSLNDQLGQSNSVCFDEHSYHELSPILDSLMSWTQAEHKRLTPLLIKRKTEGYIKACHGDLHIDNITLIDDKPTLFDGIEFSETFRWIDVMSDLAFLLIDLDFREQRPLKSRILSLYLSRTNDYNGLKLLNLYQVYRALVRAKITLLRACQLPQEHPEITALKQVARTYILQAQQYTHTVSCPKLILLQGISGSGKSCFSNQLLDHVEAITLSSDRIRKHLFGIQPLERVSKSDRQRLYSAKMNHDTQVALKTYAKEVLSLGFNVIVDATFLKHEHRQPFYQFELRKPHSIPCGTRLGYTYHHIYIQADRQLAQLSIQQRSLRNDNPSDANAEVMTRQIETLEAPIFKENSLTLKASQLRQFFPEETIKQ
ncbi:MAG: AAA family ATPase, partial [Gammaproteobacteria bacterium]|nr:AAA family ATPase [Gammaproteobacteria bacterium]